MLVFQLLPSFEPQAMSPAMLFLECIQTLNINLYVYPYCAILHQIIPSWLVQENGFEVQYTVDMKLRMKSDELPLIKKICKIKLGLVHLHD